MQADKRGGYVTYASHQAELHRLQSELDALKEGLKRKIFAPLEKAMMNALIKTAMTASKTVYTVNPCDKLTAERVREIMGEQIGAGSVEMSDLSNYESGFMTRHVLAMPDQKEDSYYWSLLCVKSNCKYFTAGKRYDYEIREDDMVIVQDDFVSDLAIGDDYKLTEEGAYWMMTESHSHGESVAIFKKNK